MSEDIPGVGKMQARRHPRGVAFEHLGALAPGQELRILLDAGHQLDASGDGGAGHHE